MKITVPYENYSCNKILILLRHMCANKSKLTLRGTIIMVCENFHIALIAIHRASSLTRAIFQQLFPNNSHRKSWSKLVQFVAILSLIAQCIMYCYFYISILIIKLLIRKISLTFCYHITVKLLNGFQWYCNYLYH